MLSFPVVNIAYSSGLLLQEAPVRMIARGGLFLSILVALAHNPCPQVFTFCLLGAYSAV